MNATVKLPTNHAAFGPDPTRPRHCFGFEVDLETARRLHAEPAFGRPPPDLRRALAALPDDGAVFLTSRALAERLSVSVEGLRRWRRLGVGPPYYQTARQRPVLYRLDEVLAWLRLTYWVVPADAVWPVRFRYRSGVPARWVYAAPPETGTAPPGGAP